MVLPTPRPSRAIDLCAPELELSDPSPELRSLFLEFDRLFFDGALENVEVKWGSARMTQCAGMCYFMPGGFCSVRLSPSLLRLRPRADLVNTLLHEMIHAYLFRTRRDRDRDGHGPDFLALAREINLRARTNITIYHTFHDEVDHHRTHWWKCDVRAVRGRWGAGRAFVRRCRGTMGEGRGKCVGGWRSLDQV